MTLKFGGRKAALIRDLSAVVRHGNTLFVGNDETAAIHALAPDGGTWTLQETYPLKTLISLPGGDGEEVDIEALAVHDGYLWVTGSHALVRRKINDTGKKALRGAADIERRPNRYVLARIPIVQKQGRSVLVATDHHRRTEQLDCGKRSSALIKWVADDSLLAPFLDLPNKENGFDIEGLAVKSGATWLGLRGPVIRGFAVILQAYLSGAKRGALKAKKLEDGRRLRKYLLPLQGLGVRDLAAWGDDLLILAGPTMSADGPNLLFRWKGANDLDASQVVDAADLTLLHDLSAAGRADRAEGLAIWDHETALIVHDGPSADRANAAAGTIRADLVSLHRRD